MDTDKIPHIDPKILSSGIELRQIEAALAAWAHGSFAEGARALGKKQTTFSELIVKLEDFVGCPLFIRSRGRDRRSGRLVLTPAGKAILPLAHRVVADLVTVCLGVRRACDGREGRIDIGCYAPIGLGTLHETLMTTSKWFDQHIRCRLVTIEHEQVSVALASRRIDVAIVRGNPAPFKGRAQPLWSERLLVAIAGNHPLVSVVSPQRKALSWKQFGDETFLISMQGPVAITREKIMAQVMPFGFSPKIEICPSDPGAVMEMVASRQGICLVPESILMDHHPGVIFLEIDGTGEDCTTYFACWRDDNPHPALKRFLFRLFHRFQVAKVDL